MAMAPQKPKREKEWPDDLGQPIIREFKLNRHVLDGAPEIWEKLARLADHYGIDRTGPPGWGHELAFRIALDCHPGFQIVYDSPIARKIGLPVLDQPSRPKGSGAFDMWTDEQLAHFAGMIKEMGGLGSDRATCEFMVEIKWKKLKGPRFASERRAKTEALRQRILRGRKIIRGKQT